MKKEIDFWLIDPNYVSAVRFYKKNDKKEEFIELIFIEEGIVMGMHGEEPPLMQTRRLIKIDEARLFWKKLINQGWQKTNPKW